MEHINWYPGHMKKTRELIAENLKMVDIVIEVIDARIPVSSRNPIIDELVKSKRRLIILNKSDLSDPKANEAWAETFKKQGNLVLTMNCMTGIGVGQLYKLLSRLQDEKNEGQLRKKSLRMIIVGVPNVGKSSLINRMTGKKSAKTGDRPGVTKGKQWIRINKNVELLDTPGILWPKFEDQSVGAKLAMIGSMNDQILNLEELSLELLGYLHKCYEGILAQRYELEESEDRLAMLSAVAKNRNCLKKGNELDYAKASNILLEEFRNGKIGRITLEQA